MLVFRAGGALCLRAVCLFGLLALASTPVLAARNLVVLEWPRTVRADVALGPELDDMRARSATFRAQCGRLDTADRLVVLLRLNPALPQGFFRARTTLHRYTSGLLVAVVEVAPGADQAGWIAHEFEHILEQIDGQDLPVLARRQARGVWRSVDGMIETTRATDAGRRVLSELRAVELHDNFVE